VSSAEFEAIGPLGLPSHQDEVMAAHEGRPTRAEQAAKLPAVDEGVDDQAKYC
jgi:hypothetical protein